MMITTARPFPPRRRFGRYARTPAICALTLLLTIGAAACSAPPAADAPSHTSVTQGDPRFEKTFRHEFADIDGVRMHYVDRRARVRHTHRCVTRTALSNVAQTLQVRPRPVAV
ncbi:hypothetical protein HTV45_04470 [Streptomyces sp. CHD11]|uniref:hypothetical protein n=1 Tax=Streptomyces sp. CHD11 TaxID=2741325 RepID=UPI001BFCC47C|nr:hypothetical protein [Streptomyces sp. CHD11]MBT3150147.1 hypothetical protein [Streptomyces sp. CHD11]